MLQGVAYLVAGISGVALWMATAQWTGRREAWDAAAYWMFAYPAGIALAGLLAFLVPHHGAWRLGLVLMLAQAFTMAFSAGSWELLPLGLALFAILAVPPATIATLASAVASNRRAGPN